MTRTAPKLGLKVSKLPKPALRRAAPCETHESGIVGEAALEDPMETSAGETAEQAAAADIPPEDPDDLAKQQAAERNQCVLHTTPDCQISAQQAALFRMHVCVHACFHGAKCIIA